MDIKESFNRVMTKLIEDTIPYNIASALQNKHHGAAEYHKRKGNMSGYRAHMDVAGKIEDAMISAGHHMPVRSKRIEKASSKAFAAHPHNKVNEEVEQLDEIGDTAKGKKALKAVISRAPEKAANLRMKSDILGRRQFDPDVGHENSEKYGKASDKAYKQYQLATKSAARAVDRLTKEEVELDEVSASTLRNYVDKARTDKKDAMKDRTVAKNNMKKYGMAMDRKDHEDASRRVVNRSTGISIANKKLNTYPTDKAKAKVMAREEVEQIDELSQDTINSYYDKAAVDRKKAKTEVEKGMSAKSFTPASVQKTADSYKRFIKRGKGMTAAANKMSEEADTSSKETVIKSVKPHVTTDTTTVLPSDVKPQRVKLAQFKKLFN